MYMSIYTLPLEYTQDSNLSMIIHVEETFQPCMCPLVLESSQRVSGRHMLSLLRHQDKDVSSDGWDKTVAFGGTLEGLLPGAVIAHLSQIQEQIKEEASDWLTHLLPRSQGSGEWAKLQPEQEKLPTSIYTRNTEPPRVY